MNPRAIKLGTGDSPDVFVIGSEWSFCDKAKDAEKILQKAPYGLIVNGSVITTLSPEFVSNNKLGKKGKYVSALALVASVERYAIVYQELGDDLVWVGAAKDYAPLPDCDRVVTTSEARSALTEFFGINPNATVIGSTADAARSLSKAFETADAKKRAQANYKKPKSPYLPLIAALAIAVVIIALMALIQTVKTTRLAAEQAKQMALAKLNEAERINTLIEEYNEEVKLSIQNARAEVSKAAQPTKQAEIWMKTILSIPLINNGFRLDKASCDTQACKYTWRALAQAPLDGPTDVGNIVERDDQSVITAIPVAQVEKSLRDNEDRIQLVSRLNTIQGVMGVSGSVSPTTPIVVPTPPKPEIPADQQAKLASIQPITVGHTSNVRVQFPIFLISQLAEILGNSVNLQTMDISNFTTNTGSLSQPVVTMVGSYAQLPR